MNKYLSPTRKKYLQGLMHFEKNSIQCRVMDLAKHLNLTHPPVSLMMTKLENMKYITRSGTSKDQNRVITLTEKGLRECM